MFRFVGNEVIGDIHLGDWGPANGPVISELELKQPGLAYFQRGHDGPFPDEPPITLGDLEKLYPAGLSRLQQWIRRADLARARRRKSYRTAGPAIAPFLAPFS
ncbi:MAG: hypothetical protein R3C40_01400 [Parvularculaceae bacterium]